MGMLKIDHIKRMLEMPTINEVFKTKYNRNYDKKDIDKIYELFEAS